MYCFISEHTDVYWNLALEEFLLKLRSEDFFFLWRSDSAVVFGKHQNPYKEINIQFANDNHIQVARRLSGGGTVFQDSGNINFTFIRNTEEGKQINLQKHSKPIFNALRALGIDVEYSKRNDMLIEGKKFSGNAEHVFKNRVLHHGTILYNSDLDALESVLKAKDGIYTDKTIASVRSKVTNISPYLETKYSTKEFSRVLLDKVLEQNSDFRITDNFSNNKEILSLKKEKYNTDEWIFCYTPKYQLNHSFTYNEKECSIHLSVKKGTIEEFKTSGLPQDVSVIMNQFLLKQKHLGSTVNHVIKQLPEDYQFLKQFLI
jgi:lipoate-protein ligase A